MKKLLLASTLAIASFPGYAAEPKPSDTHAAGTEWCLKHNEAPRQECLCLDNLQDGEAAETEQQKVAYDQCMKSIKPEPRRVRFQPRQMIWQCNDLRVTWTETAPGVFNYDIGGTIWGGINFTYTPRGLFLRGVPCVPLR